MKILEDPVVFQAFLTAYNTAVGKYKSTFRFDGKTIATKDAKNIIDYARTKNESRNDGQGASGQVAK